jgi:hypothetical protein
MIDHAPAAHDRPRYRQVAASVRAQIEDGTLST